MSALRAASDCGDTAIALRSSPDLSQSFKLAEIDCEVSSKDKQTQKACVMLRLDFVCFFYIWTIVVNHSNTP